MATSSVWKYWNRVFDKPIRMICRLCNTCLSTHNCGNAKKHLRYKHINEYLEVQLIDQQSKVCGRQFKNPTHSIKKLAKQSRKTLTIEEITAALLMPKLESTEHFGPSSLDETQSHSSNAVLETNNQVPLFQKAIKIKAVELVLEIEGNNEPVRLSFPCQEGSNYFDREIMNALNTV